MPCSTFPRSILGTFAIAALATSALTGCSGGMADLGESYTHGYVQSEDAIAQISVGSSREQVILVLGSPSTTSTIGGESFYYISQKNARSMAFMQPALVDQRVLAVYFDDKGTVKDIANYGMQDGKIFDFISRRTKTTGQDVGFIGQLFRGGTAFGPSLPK
jgi:outer membrane protein assembly factor BamE (lipoprotein component of BamABCDE complex)